jgi:aralkylamine N-acetyltransferase
MASEITIEWDLARVDWRDVQSIVDAIGWPKREIYQLELAFGKSSHKAFAFLNDRLVGLVRTTDDGVNIAVICDLMVHPDFQGMGIGSRLLHEMLEACSHFRFLNLTAAEGKDGFYIKQGWRRQRSSFLWPRDDEQTRIHVEP